MPDPAGGTPVTENFSSPEGRFRFGLPGRALTPAAQKDRTFKWFILNIGQFQIFYVDRETPVDTPDISKTYFDNFRENAATRGTVTVDSELNLSGHPGRELRIQTAAGTQIERVYLAGNRIYVLSVFVPESLGCKVGSAVETLDTFEITDEQSGN